MDFDDIVYLGLLFFSIFFGLVYRDIPEPAKRKNVGTLVGIVIIFIVSGLHLAHALITVLVNILIISFISKKWCHIVSFTFSFLYLFFFRITIYFGIPYPPPHTNMIQMILTLKLVGLAFEVNSNYLKDLELKKHDKSLSFEKALNDEKSLRDDFQLNALEIFHYSFNYVGVIAGPYYKFKTFQDYFNLPFSQYSSGAQATINKIKFVPLFAVLFLFGSYNWPLSYALTDEFFQERSFLYRLWYIWPTFFVFRMRIYIGLVLSECICTMAGFGAYPVFTKPKSGLGPSEEYQKMKDLANSSSSKLAAERYDFETIHNINPYGSDFCTTVRESMKHWNICVQYWLAVNVYKRFPNKKFRTAVTMLVSSTWHGVYTGYYVCIGCVPFYLPIEDIYVKLFLKNRTGIRLLITEWMIWFVKMFSLSYLAIAFHLLTLPKIWHYYNSIYHAGFVIWIILYLVGVQLLKRSKREGKNGDERVKGNIKVD